MSGRDWVVGGSAIVTAGATVALWLVTTDYIKITAKIYEAQQRPLLVVMVPTIVEDAERKVYTLEIVARNASSSGVAYGVNPVCDWYVNGTKELRGDIRSLQEPMMAGPQARIILQNGEQPEPEYSQLRVKWEIECYLPFADFADRKFHSGARFGFLPAMGATLKARFSTLKGWCKDDKGRDCGKSED